jgi:1-acyl-sn-glycerol-3-phosphate acyltransferase
VRPVRVDPVRADPVRADPVRADPVKVDPVKVDPGQGRPIKVDPVEVGPGDVGAGDAGQIPVRRGTVETAPLKRALAVLAAGGIVGVFPEGTRGGGDVQQVRHGIAYLAVRSGAPVVPVAWHGAVARKGRAFWSPRRPPIRVALGVPLRLPCGPASRRTVAAAAAEIHRTLAAHLAATRPEPERDQP